MNPRRPVFWVATLALLLIALMLWRRKSEDLETPKAASVTSNLPTSTVAQNQSSLTESVPTAVQATNASGRSNVGNGERMAEVLSANNDVAIDFYGKLEDQYGSPISSAEIKGSIMVINGTRAGSDLLTTKSDENGLFQFHGKGQDIGIMPRKEGYVIATTGTLFKFSRLEDHPYVSQAINPAVIKMWKLQGAEPLLRINEHFRIPYSNTPIFIDFPAGQIVQSGGDIKISVNRPDGTISQQHPQNWSIKFEPVNGGFVVGSETESPVTFVAPTNGYVPSGDFANNNGPDLIDQTLFIQSRNGQIYSKVHLLFGINNNPDGFMNITFSGVANTNGSRNWEDESNSMKSQ